MRVGCVALSIHCVWGDKQLTSVTLLLTRTRLRCDEAGVEQPGGTEMQQIERKCDGERGTRRNRKEESGEELCCSFVRCERAGLGLFYRVASVLGVSCACAASPWTHLKASIHSHCINI